MWINFKHHHQIYQAHFPSCSMFKISVISSLFCIPFNSPFSQQSPLSFFVVETFHPHPFPFPWRRLSLKLLEEKLRFIGESSQSWAALEELEWFQNGRKFWKKHFGRKVGGFIPLETYHILVRLGSSSPKRIKGENQPKLGNLEFRTCNHHVPILLIW